MRRCWLVVGWCALVVGCAQRSQAKVAGDGQLVLELGGGGRSLAASLRGLGVELLPPRELPPAPVVTPTPAASDAGKPPSPQAEPPRRGNADDAVVPAANGEWFEVELKPRQTLMDIAHKHLGSGLRFKELLTLNGWSEKDARRLRAGQKVKVPKAAR